MTEPGVVVWVCPSQVGLVDSADDLRDGVGTTGDGLVAALALPDTNSLALDGVLSAEGADVAGVLGDFHLLHLLTQGGTVSVEGWSIFDSFVSLLVRVFMVVRGRVRGFGRDAYLVPYLPVIPTSGKPLAMRIRENWKGRTDLIEQSSPVTYSWCAWSSCLSAAVDDEDRKRDRKTLRKSGCGWRLA